MQGITHPPPKLSERDLINAMERHGIGTDATVADHIQKQLDRGYAVKDASALFSPSPLGEALIAGYHKMGLSNLWQPNLRSNPYKLLKPEQGTTFARCSAASGQDMARLRADHLGP